LILTANRIRRRGKQKEPTLALVSLRLPKYVVDHFRLNSKHTQEMRRVLTEYVDNLEHSRLEEDESDR